MDQTYGQAYRELYEKHWWWRARTEFILKTLSDLPGSGPRKEVLDVGCGDGLFFDRLAEFGNVEGVEPSPELVSESNPHRHRIHVCPFDVDFQPGKRYSLLLMLDVLEHLANPVAALRHAMGLLEPDGNVIITVPAFLSAWTSHDVLNHHYTRYTKSSFRRIAEQAGLRIREDRYFFHWTYPMKLAAHGIEKILPATPKLPKVPPAFINSALLWLSLAEQKTLTRLPMPFGTSLMIMGNGGDVF